jgi:hypothetical protein
MLETSPSPSQVRAWIAESIERSPCGHSLDQIAADIDAGAARLWVGRASAVVTQPVLGERIWHAGGDMGDLIDQLKRAEAVFRRAGVERLTIEDTRKGWAKILRPHGFVAFQGLEHWL